jgi:hypothetical protein
VTGEHDGLCHFLLSPTGTGISSNQTRRISPVSTHFLAVFFQICSHQQQSRASAETMVFGSVFTIGGSSGTGSPVGISEATEEDAAVTSTAKDKLSDGGRSSKFGFIRNLPFLANIRQKDIVLEGTAGSKEAPHDHVGVPLSPVRAKGANRVTFQDLVGESGPCSAPLSHVPSESDVDSSAAVFEDISWGGSPGKRNERKDAGSDRNQEPNSENPVIPCEGFLSKHIQQQIIGDNGKATRSRSRDRKQKVDHDKPSDQRVCGREKIDDETLASRRSRETQSSRRSFSTSRSYTGKISLSRRSSNRRREDDAFPADHVAPTTGSRSTTESENDRNVRSSSLERYESSSRRPPESPRKRTEKPTGSIKLRVEKPSESPRKKTMSLRKFNLDSPRKTPTSPRKNIVEAPPPPPESPRKKTEKPTDAPRLRGEKPPESPRKRTETSRKLSVDSPRKTPTSPRKKIMESPRKMPESQRKIILSSPTKTPYSQKNRVSDSPRKSASDCLRKTSSISLLTEKESSKKDSPSRVKPESPRKIAFSPRKSTSRLALADQSLLEGLTRKLLIDNTDRGPENFKAAKTNEVIKKHIQEEAAMTGSKRKESTSSTPRVSPGRSSSPKEPNKRTEESKSWGEVVRLVGCKQDLPVPYGKRISIS